jgi:hypothetical protein
LVAAWLIDCHKVGTPVGAKIYTVERLIIQREAERQAHKRIAVIGVITNVGITGHDRVCSVSEDVLAWRTTGDIVIPRKVRVRITIRISDCPGGYVRSQASTKWDIQSKLGRHI